MGKFGDEILEWIIISSYITPLIMALILTIDKFVLGLVCIIITLVQIICNINYIKPKQEELGGYQDE
jgi:hypothetical protein